MRYILLHAVKYCTYVCILTIDKKGSGSILNAWSWRMEFRFSNTGMWRCSIKGDNLGRLSLYYDGDMIGSYT